MLLVIEADTPNPVLNFFPPSPVAPATGKACSLSTQAGAPAEKHGAGWGLGA